MFGRFEFCLTSESLCLKGLQIALYLSSEVTHRRKELRYGPNNCKEKKASIAGKFHKSLESLKYFDVF